MHLVCDQRCKTLRCGAEAGCVGELLAAFSGRWSMIRKSGNRFSLAANAEPVCAEIMLKTKT
jgi:hypothetical protein